MHYLALILVSLVTLSSTVFAVKQGWARNEQTLSSNEVLDPLQSVFAELKKPLYFKPVEIQIGKTDLEIEEVGLQKDGTLGIPSDWKIVGWYARSAKPGQEGNVIMDGHYDTDTGAPAAFWDLKTLTPNDKVTLKDESERLFTYKVVEVFYVDMDDPGRARVFDEGLEDKSELTLVTCGGVWDPSRGSYDKRLVVKAELI